MSEKPNSPGELSLAESESEPMASATETVPVPASLEENRPMLDVHPPHHAVHSWRDFFIHIATIVVGLIIAVGLEQVVEAVHHREQRAELREDLRVEARQRIQRLDTNVKSTSNDLDWYREVMRAGREAPVSGGFVTFTLPPKKRLPYIADAVNGVWSAAKASGVVAVLPREEIELWDNVDSDATVNNHVAQDFNDREEAQQTYHGLMERLGLRASPGATLRLTTANLDLLMEAVAKVYEATWQYRRDEIYWEATCQAVLDGAKTTDELAQHAERTIAAMPQ